MNKTMSHRGPAILAVTAIMALGACAETKQVPTMAAAPAPTFLPDAALMQKNTTGEGANLVYFKPNTNWRSYNKVLLEPVTIWTGAGSNMDKVPPQQRQALANTLHANLHNGFARRCTMVTEHGPGTMVVRVALVDASSPNMALNTISTYIPQAHALTELASYAFNDGVAYWVGEATGEGFVKDSTNGALLWEAAEERAGTKAFRRNTFNSWGDVDNAFKAWGDQVASRIVALGACPGQTAS